MTDTDLTQQHDIFRKVLIASDAPVQPSVYAGSKGWRPEYLMERLAWDHHTQRWAWTARVEGPVLTSTGKAHSRHRDYERYGDAMYSRGIYLDTPEWLAPYLLGREAMHAALTLPPLDGTIEQHFAPYGDLLTECGLHVEAERWNTKHGDYPDPRYTTRRELVTCPNCKRRLDQP